MTDRSRKLSEIITEMAELLLRDPSEPSPEAAQVALLLANAAWNECVGLDHARENYRNGWETMEAANPALWNELKSNDIDAMIDELAKYKKTHYPDDRRRILVCGMVDDKVHVEWLVPAVPGVDPEWEMHLYGLVRAGEREKAIRFLQETRNVSRKAARERVAGIAAKFRNAGI